MAACGHAAPYRVRRRCGGNRGPARAADSRPYAGLPARSVGRGAHTPPNWAPGTTRPAINAAPTDAPAAGFVRRYRIYNAQAAAGFGSGGGFLKMGSILTIPQLRHPCNRNFSQAGIFVYKPVHFPRKGIKFCEIWPVDTGYLPFYNCAINKPNGVCWNRTI